MKDMDNKTKKSSKNSKKGIDKSGERGYTNEAVARQGAKTPEHLENYIVQETTNKQSILYEVK